MLKSFFLSEKNILIAIILNAMLIFWMGFPEYAQETFLLFIEIGFILFFFLEVIIKVEHYGFGGYLKDNFNKLDFFVVISSLPVLLSIFIPEITFKGFILFRLLRLLRLTRFFVFIPNMAQLMVGLKRAFKSSVFVFLSLVLYIFVLSIITCEIFGKVGPEYFGNPLISFYTTFQLFTLEGWNEIVDKLALRFDTFHAGMTRLYFMMVVLSGGIFGISLANAVFVDEMTMDNNIALEEKMDKMALQLEEMKRLLEER